ncbi:EAL domain-containing protein [Klebsiella pneumoniae]|nr:MULTISPECIES: EAL domain-containing protein [Enterobacterales]MEB0923194.1 EAL domain-containing protein [Citrobacter freundii]QXZ02601.1 EAL domain-containing protein [Enterobacter hormaechei subsp. steigerwaltii]MBC4622454.1 EAL domain-containing protein [Klebsiella pneumoniae]MCA4933049.1 EAL domain-containing protein [Klebsiella pneumoniae]MCA4960118.1 EAL domain-containing protein [Klebsiella pneumoniae]
MVKLYTQLLHVLSNDDMDKVLLSSIIDYVKVKGMKCIIEGVENYFLLSISKGTNATAAQGYLWSGDYDLYDMARRKLL